MKSQFFLRHNNKFVWANNSASLSELSKDVVLHTPFRVGPTPTKVKNVILCLKLTVYVILSFHTAFAKSGGEFYMRRAERP